MTRVAAASIACLLLTACVDGGDEDAALSPRLPVATPTTADVRVIGLVGSMSGDDAWRGEDAFEGADLAVHIMNRGVEEGRPPFQLVTLDDEGDPATATALVQRLAGDDRTVGIVFAGPAEALPATERALTLAGIPAVLCYGDLYSARLLRPHLFQVSPPFLWQARTMARYIDRDRGYERVGVVTERTFNSQVAAASLRSAFTEGGVAPPTIVKVPRDWRERRGPAIRGLARGELARLRSRRVEAVVVHGPTRFIADVAAGIRAAETARWTPQVIGFDLAISPNAPSLPVGTAATDTYSRGTHFLPIPTFERFRERFRDWWDGDEPLGWEVRAYDAASMIGWAAQKTPAGSDVAATLELLQGARFGGLDVTFGPDDHTAVEQQAVGLWVRPRTAFDRLIPTSELPWLPLARGFSIDGDRTAVLNRDWRYLFRDPPPPEAPAPRVGRMRYAVDTPRSDPIH